MWRADSFEKTLMLGKIKGRRRGQQRMRWLDGHLTWWTGFGGTPGVGDGQGGLACWGSWGRKESDTTERLNWTELKDNTHSEKCISMHLNIYKRSVSIRLLFSSGNTALLSQQEFILLHYPVTAHHSPKEVSQTFPLILIPQLGLHVFELCIDRIIQYVFIFDCLILINLKCIWFIHVTVYS